MDNLKFEHWISSIRLKAGDQHISQFDLLTAKRLLTELEYAIRLLERKEELDHERSVRYQREEKCS